MGEERKAIPLKEGMWTIEGPAQEPRLIGSQCSACGEIFFPKKEKGWCVRCQQMTLREVRLGPRGRIVSHSVVMQQPGGGFYKGPVPYAYGEVDLPEGVRIVTLFACHDFDQLKPGIEVELLVEKICEDEHGNEVLTFKFKPKETQTNPGKRVCHEEDEHDA
jgi:uncharacterized OB-fold protein